MAGFGRPLTRGGEQYSGLPTWPKEAQEVPDDTRRERYYWFYILPIIAVGIGVIRAGIRILLAGDQLTAEEWGEVTGAFVALLPFAFLIGYLLDRSRWAKDGASDRGRSVVEAEPPTR